MEGAKNLSSEMKRIKGVLENMNSGDNQENNLNAPNKEESVTDIENKIRGTRKVYKELKNFLGEFLTRIDPLQKGGFAGGNLGNLLQTLWNDFQDGDDKQYTKMSFLVSHFKFVLFYGRNLPIVYFRNLTSKRVTLISW